MELKCNPHFLCRPSSFSQSCRFMSRFYTSLSIFGISSCCKQWTIYIYHFLLSGCPFVCLYHTRLQLHRTPTQDCKLHRTPVGTISNKSRYPTTFQNCGDLSRQQTLIRHVFGFGIEFLENKDIGIFGHIIVIDFIKRYSYHTYFSPISTSWFRRYGTGCIVRSGEWRIFVNYSVFSALFPLKLHVIFEEGTPVQKDAVPPLFISNYHR